MSQVHTDVFVMPSYERKVVKFRSSTLTFDSARPRPVTVKSPVDASGPYMGGKINGLCLLTLEYYVELEDVSKNKPDIIT